MKIKLITCGLLIFSFKLSQSMDNFHFYRAHPFLGETRLDTSCMTSFDVQVFGGSTSTALNSCGKKVPLFARTGYEDFKELPVELPFFTKQQFKKAFCLGHFSIIETQLQAYINSDCGFFAHFHLPIRRFKLNHVLPTGRTDIFLTDKLTTDLQAVESELQREQLTACNFKKTGIGDLAVLIGWTGTTYDTIAVDFLDFTIQTGILFPTSKKKDLSHIFDVPFGYNGHYANSLIVDGAAGFLDWITVGAHAEALFFWDRHQSARFNLENSSGLLRFKKGCARVKEGNIWSLSAYCKADHFISGFSLLLGYSHDHQSAGAILPGNNNNYLTTITDRQDPLLRGWDMDIFHIILEYDCADEDLLNAPRFGMTYNHVISGRNIFTTSTVGGFVGAHIIWDF